MARTYGRLGELMHSGIVLAALFAVAALAARPAGAADACGGDCDLNWYDAFNELVRGVNISLGSGDLATCTAMDGNHSQQVEVNELVTGVNHSLAGCPPIECVAPPGGRCVEITPGPNAQE